MKCQNNRGNCPNTAAFVRDIPNLGESLCFCVDCVNKEIMHYNQDFGWYALTPDREKLEVAGEELLEIWKSKMSGSFWKK